MDVIGHKRVRQRIAREKALEMGHQMSSFAPTKAAAITFVSTCARCGMQMCDDESIAQVSGAALDGHCSGSKP